MKGIIIDLGFVTRIGVWAAIVIITLSVLIVNIVLKDYLFSSMLGVILTAELYITYTKTRKYLNRKNEWR